MEERKVLNHLFVNVFNKILRIEERVIREQSDLDLTVSEMHTIDAIGIGESMKMTDVADKLNITVGTLTTSINRLLSKGYVERNRGEEDRRVVRVHLTEKGKEAYDLHEAYHEEMISQILSELNEEEARILTGTLIKISEFFRVHYHAED
ncbi:MarR family transcriptional regulator [Proteiniclasticum sp. QWL-01]|uniref:MarR family winged helix-turn-helix transcriptional regulator n=1 Tax=Proteiniclasticum sp. QWL-01 TaxID=3036945 RepID=UPI0024112CED|nr:MarR family transcriptional regulator [Proteiniclasticum sp. QWL-01]WFF74427.1 MarR family transcriptional regulator [Proteiniclasticum sp. QWL-01]